MTELKETLKILTARAQEIILIIGTFTVSSIAASMTMDSISLQDEPINIPANAVPLLLFAMVSSFLYVILSNGFLRTAYLTGIEPQAPSVLFKTGLHFFWRIMGFALSFFIISGTISLFFNFLLKSMAGTTTDLSTLSLLVSKAMLMKMWLLIPAIIIVLDCRLLHGWQMLSSIKLSDSKTLIVLFTVQLIIAYLISSQFSPAAKPQNIKYFQMGIAFAILELIDLTTSVVAVRFVASRNIAYNSETNGQ